MNCDFYNGKYYLYRHIRPDKDEPFYIGVGTKSEKDMTAKTITTYYERAYSIHSHNKIWQDIVNKNSGNYEVEILAESNDRDFLSKREVEFIKLYGRKNLKTGILANLTDGGEGLTGFKWTDEMRLKASERGKNMSSYLRAKISIKITQIQLKKIYQYDLNGDFIKEWMGIKTASQKLRISKTGISQCAKEKVKTAGGFIWRYQKFDKLINLDIKKWKEKKIYRFDKSWNLIEEFSSIKEASIKTGINISSLYECASFKRNHVEGEFWITENKLNIFGIEFLKTKLRINFQSYLLENQ